MATDHYVTYKLSDANHCDVAAPISFDVKEARHTISAELSVSDSGILLLRLTGDELKRGSRRLTDHIAKRTMEWLAINKSLSFQLPEVHENTLPKRSWQTGQWGEWVTFTTPSAPTLTYEDGQALQSHMENGPDVVSLVYGMYGLAAEQQSPTAEFFLLYSLLEFIHGGQKSIDEWIWDVKPDEERVPDARYENEGTRFTKLRNDLGHLKRLSPDELDSLVPKVKAGLPALRELAKIAIKQFAQ